MKANTVKPPRRPGQAMLLAAAAAAVSAVLVWSGTSAVATVVEVAASASGRATQSPDGLAAAPAPPEASQAAGATHHSQASDPADARSFQEMPPENATPQGLGNKPEVSLEEAGRAEVGYAASSGKDSSRNLPKAGTATPGDILGATLSLGGCLREYGEAGQCLPDVPPSLTRHLQEMKDAGADPASMPHNWTCDEVRKYFMNGLTVRQTGVDPQRLDTNADGIACGPGD